MINKKALSLWFATLLLCAPLLALSPAARGDFTVVTYNVENLFDVDRVSKFDDYEETDEPNSYGPDKLLGKLRAISAVLKKFNAGKGPDVILFNEFEIDHTPKSRMGDPEEFLRKYSRTTAAKMLGAELSDEIRGLPAEAFLLKHLEDEGLKGYRIAVGNDDPASEKLAHKNAVFSRYPILSSETHPTEEARGILEVRVDVDGSPLTLFCNHWKSGASNFKRERIRRDNARTVRARLNEILKKDPFADIIVAGDFNSQYNQTDRYPYMWRTALNDFLGSQGDETAMLRPDGPVLYNLWYELPAGERRSDAYNGEWGTLMNIMVTRGLYDRAGIQYVDKSFAVAAYPGLNTRKSLGLPARWSNFAAGSGVSDHFPVSACFRTAGRGRAGDFVTLKAPSRGEGASADPIQVGYQSLRAGDLRKFTELDIKDDKRLASELGEFFLVEATVSKLSPRTVKVAGREFRWYSFDSDIRRIQGQFDKGDKTRFIGELSFFRRKQEVQFLIHDMSWLLRPE